MARRRLIPHPDTPAAIDSVEARIARTESGGWYVAYAIVGRAADLLLPEASAPERAEGLWSHSCFELFVRPGEEGGYFEFNFSPSTRWAAYQFDGYRQGMRDFVAGSDPAIESEYDDARYVLAARPDLSALPAAPVWRVGLSAVIEERGGRKSYWALAHPPGAPDFHHDACFALELPPAIAA